MVLNICSNKILLLYKRSVKLFNIQIDIPHLLPLLLLGELLLRCNKMSFSFWSRETVLLWGVFTIPRTIPSTLNSSQLRPVPPLQWPDQPENWTHPSFVTPFETLNHCQEKSVTFITLQTAFRRTKNINCKPFLNISKLNWQNLVFECLISISSNTEQIEKILNKMNEKEWLNIPVCIR